METEMFLNLLLSNPAEFFLLFSGLVIAIGLHEAAHCYTADKLGDPTPRSQGRLTLNPINHLDPLGTLAILLVGFGWGRAAPFDPYNLANPKRDTALIALAGPATNFTLALLIAFVIRATNLPFSVNNLLFNLLTLNLGLAIFNLLPLPPLDGSKIFAPSLRLDPNTGYLILILLLVTGAVSAVIRPIIGFLVNILV